MGTSANELLLCPANKHAHFHKKALPACLHRMPGASCSAFLTACFFRHAGHELLHQSVQPHGQAALPGNPLRRSILIQQQQVPIQVPCFIRLRFPSFGIFSSPCHPCGKKCFPPPFVSGCFRLGILAGRFNSDLGRMHHRLH